MMMMPATKFINRSTLGFMRARSRTQLFKESLTRRRRADAAGAAHISSTVHLMVCAAAAVERSMRAILCCQHICKLKKKTPPHITRAQLLSKTLLEHKLT